MTEIFKLNILTLKDSQQKALKRLQMLIANADLGSSMKKEEFVEAYECLDSLLYFGLLASRCPAKLVSSRQMKKGLNGITFYTSDCYYHQGTHNAYIWVRSMIRHSKPWMKMFETLLHETSHAFCDLFFSDRRTLSIIESIELLGLTGHGSLWRDFYEISAAFLRSHACLYIEYKHDISFHVQKELYEQKDIWKRWALIVRDCRRNDLIYRNIASFFGFDSICQPLRQLIAEGRDLLEIIVYIKHHKWLGDWCRPHQSDHIPQDSVESVSVRPYNGKEIHDPRQMELVEDSSKIWQRTKRMTEPLKDIDVNTGEEITLHLQFHTKSLRWKILQVTSMDLKGSLF